MLKLITLVTAGLGLVSAQLQEYTTSSCKVLPGDPGWPTISEWQSLANKTNGNLIKYTPPGAVCSSSSGVYDADKCAYVRANYGKQAFDQADPGLVNALWYTGNTCAPSEDPSMVCTQGNFPEYVLKAKNAKDISHVIKFAAKKDIRVVVKNTGHDFIGRSIGRGSIGIHMHEWQGYQTIPAFSSGCKGSTPHAAAKLTGGIQWTTAYKAAVKDKQIIIGGSSGTVGPTGGYTAGGGHSAFSMQYGMAVDQVLEFEVVMLDGTITKVNECTQPELWWALRGGGPSTFAVVTSITVKTYPEPPVVEGELNILNLDTAGLSEDWWKMVGEVNTALGHLSDNNVSGYYYAYPKLKNFNFKYYHTVADPKITEEVWAPLVEKLEALKAAGKATYTLTRNQSSWAAIAARFAYDDGVNYEYSPNTGAIMSSRLLPRETMEKDPAAWLAAMKSMSAGSNMGMLGHLVSGGKVHENKNLDMALLPAWRTAISHLIVIANSAVTDTPEQLEQKKAELRASTQVMRDLSPNSGAYMNEGDLDEPNKYQAFFGSNAPKLLALKRKYDPTGVMYCGTCIGSDDWTNTAGKLCRKKVFAK